ncbi:hypothetical protein [Caballeronia cordobensis]|uniref:hypothetical protein n=2 Tax=Caballeronia cordobensis TaxID=1353886 RepID=UPI0006AD6511|nr:hypothetical protein [Caballeronia cordobensis]
MVSRSRQCQPIYALFENAKSCGNQIVDWRFGAGSSALRNGCGGRRMPASDGAGFMREKISRSARKSNGVLDKMRASGSGSTAWTGRALTAKKDKRQAASAKAPGIECERNMARKII